MFEYYPQIKQAHLFLALSSGALFALRGAAALLDAQWHQSLLVKRLSYAIDIALLTAAIMLLPLLPKAMFENGWLLAKVALVAVYIVLGIGALRLAKTKRSRAACYGAALLVFGLIYGIARTHHPLGFLQPLAS